MTALRALAAAGRCASRRALAGARADTLLATAAAGGSRLEPVRGPPERHVGPPRPPRRCARWPARRGLTRRCRRSAPSSFAGGERIAVPVTIAWGAKDRLLLPRQARRAARAIPRARIVLLEGCGHVPTYDDPEQVARVLLEGSAARALRLGPCSARPGGHRPCRVGDPLAPGPRIQRRAAKPASSSASTCVSGGDARAAVGADLGRRLPAGPPRSLGAARSAPGTGPSASRLRAIGRLRAPGMCPATGSIGSVSPRKRSAARASSRTPVAASARGAGRRREPACRPGRAAKSPAMRRRLVALCERPAGREPRGQAAVEHRHLRVAEVPQQPPGPGGRQTRWRRHRRPPACRRSRRPRASPRSKSSAAGQRMAAARGPAARPGRRRGRRTPRPGCGRRRRDRGWAPVAQLPADVEQRLGRAVREVSTRSVATHVRCHTRERRGYTCASRPEGGALSRRSRGPSGLGAIHRPSLRQPCTAVSSAASRHAVRRPRDASSPGYRASRARTAARRPGRRRGPGPGSARRRTGPARRRDTRRRTSAGGPRADRRRRGSRRRCPTTLAAVPVTAMTGTASPSCRPLAEA